MDSSQTHTLSKEKRYDPAVNLYEETCHQMLNNHPDYPVSGDEAGELSSGDEAPDRIHNDLSMARSGPQGCCEVDYCEGGILAPKYAAKNPHISQQTKMYPADENRWQCRKPHPKLCKPCYSSKTCPVHGLDFGRL